MNKQKQFLIVIGNNVRIARKNFSLSQEQLAEKACLHRTYIGMIERAEKNITILNLKKIADALEVKISSLIDDS